MTLAKLVAPAAAGVLLGLAGIGAVLLLELTGLLVAAAATLLARVSAAATVGGAAHEPLGRSLRGTWELLRAQPQLRLLLAIFTVANALIVLTGALVTPIA